MLTLTLRDILFGGAGAAVLGFVQYLLKRRIERKRESESVDLEKRELELIDYFLSNKDKWESSGQYVEVPASIAAKVTKSITPQQWTEAYTTLGAHHIRAVHSTCMWFEGIAANYPEYQFALLLWLGIWHTTTYVSGF